MRKFILLFVVSFILNACTTEEAYRDYGNIHLKLDESKDIITSSGAASMSDLINYNIAIHYQNTNLWNGKYQLFQSTEFSYPVGDGYSIYAESCTLTEAQDANDGWGKLRTSGKSDLFTIVSNQTTDVTLVCSVQNAKLSVSYDPSFTAAFTEYSVLVYKTSDENRKITFQSDATFDTLAAYFNIDAHEEVRYEVVGKYNGISQKYIGILPISKAKWYRLSIKMSPSISRNLASNILPSVEVDMID